MVLRSRPESELKFHRVSRTFNTERRYVELYVDTLCSILLLTVCRTFIPSKEWDEDGTVAENVLLVRYPVFLFWYFWLVTDVRRPDPIGVPPYRYCRLPRPSSTSKLSTSSRKRLAANSPSSARNTRTDKWLMTS
jgi:hypothetical protein